MSATDNGVTTIDLLELVGGGRKAHGRLIWRTWLELPSLDVIRYSARLAPWLAELRGQHPPVPRSYLDPTPGPAAHGWMVQAINEVHNGILVSHSIFEHLGPPRKE